MKSIFNLFMRDFKSDEEREEARQANYAAADAAMDDIIDGVMSRYNWGKQHFGKISKKLFPIYVPTLAISAIL